MFAPGVGSQVDVLEHERPQLVHGRRGGLALDDVPRGLGVLDQVVDEHIDPVRSAVAELGDGVRGQVRFGDHAGAKGVVDVVVDVRDTVEQPDDLAFDGRRLRGAAGMVEDPVPDRLA